MGDLEVRPHERVVLVQGHDVPLTSGEFDIVETLAEHPGWVYSAEQLCRGPESCDHSPESVSVLVSRLRHRLAEAGLPDAVETVRGFGYRLRAPAAPGGESSAVAAVSRELRDASWRLQQAVIEAEHSGTPEQQGAATAALETARHAIYSTLAE